MKINDNQWLKFQANKWSRFSNILKGHYPQKMSVPVSKSETYAIFMRLGIKYQNRTGVV